MKPQDIFGASPKTVLNKPFMHVREVYPAGTSGVDPVAGWNDNVLNTVVINNIADAALSSNIITLPAGEYYIEAERTWRIYNTVTTARLVLADISDNVLLYGLTLWSAIGASQMNNYISFQGSLVLTQPTQVKLRVYSDTDDHASSGADVAGIENVFTDLRIWKLDENVETVVINDPDMTLDKPFMHVQDQKASNVDGGNSIDGWNDRDLNTVITNNIAGAELKGNNTVSLPAGTYFVSAEAMMFHSSSCRVLTAIRTAADNILIQGTNFRSSESDGGLPPVSGKFVLNEATDVKLSQEIERGLGGTGLGNTLHGSLTPNVYADLKIWKLDGIVKQPVASASKSYNGAAYLTGGVNGLELKYNSANTIDVLPGDCMDSTNTIPLGLLGVELDIAVPATEGVHNIFITDDLSAPIKTDTDVDGSNVFADPNVSYARWIGFVLTDSSGNLKSFIHQSDIIKFAGVGKITVPNNWYNPTIYNWAGSIPNSRISSFFLHLITPASYTSLYCSVPGTTSVTLMTANQQQLVECINNGNIEALLTGNGANATAELAGAVLKR